MHAVDLGIRQTLMEVIFADLLRIVGGIFTKSVLACGKIINMLRAAASVISTPCVIGKLTIRMFIEKTSARPKMKIKAAEGRYMFEIVYVLLNLFAPKNTISKS